MKPPINPREPDAEENEPLVSVVIVTTTNRQDCLPRLFSSLQQQTYPRLETIVVDNGVQPPLSLRGFPAKLLRNDFNTGVCFARNQGCAAAGGEFVLYLDDDTELAEPDTITGAVCFALAHPNVAAVGFAQLTADGAMKSDQPAHSNCACYAEKFYGYGCLLRRAAQLQVGGFNDLFNYYYEENELALSLTEAGYDIAYVPQLRVIHHQEPRGRDWTHIHRLFSRNLLICILQRYPWYIVPWSVLHAIVNFSIRARQQRGGDWRGLWWIFTQLIRLFKPILAGRRPVRWQTLREHRRMRRSGGARIDHAPTPTKTIRCAKQLD